MDDSLFKIYFEDPYWVGIIEQHINDSYSVARIVFGSEPSDAEILEYLSKNYPNNVRFTRPVDATNQKIQRINPKRRQREAANLLNQRGTSTKAQEIMQRSYEQFKQEKQHKKRQLKEEAAEQKYLQKVARKKQKHRGR